MSDHLLLAEDAARMAASEMEKAKLIAETLLEHYPGHQWACNVDEPNGIATVVNLGLSGKHGFVLHLKDAYSTSKLKRMAIMAGGEVLERYRQRRGAVDPAAIAAMAVDVSGNHIPDL